MNDNVPRDDKGRWLPGTKTGSPGRPSRAREERYYQIMMTAVTFADWEVIVKKAAEQAKRGDAVARKWLADYLVGAPIQKLEHTGENGGAIVITVVDQTE